MKRVLLFVIMVSLILVSAIGCSESKPYRIGVVGTMSGNQSDLSVSGRRGIEMAVEALNAGGGINGRPIELVVKDDENNTQRAAAIVQEFVDDQVHLVIGHFTSGMMLGAYEAVEANDILYLGPTISTDLLSGLDDHFIRFIASTKEQADVLTAYAKEHSIKDFVIVIDEKNSGFIQKLLENFTANLTRDGGNVLDVIEYQVRDEALDQAIATSIDKYPQTQGVFIIANASDLAVTSQELRKRGVDTVEVFGPLWAHTNDLIRIGGQFAEGIKLVSGLDEQYSLQTYLDFKQSYTQRYGEDVTFASVYSYETMMALAQALLDTKDDDPMAVKAALLKFGTFTGLQENFSLDEYGDNTRQYMLDEIINGTYQRID